MSLTNGIFMIVGIGMGASAMKYKPISLGELIIALIVYLVMIISLEGLFRWRKSK